MRTLLMLPLLLLPFTAQAASLLPGGDYPAPDCRSPLRPLPGDSPMDWRMYRSDMEAYRQCVEAHNHAESKGFAGSPSLPFCS